MQIDDMDRRLLRYYQADPGISAAALAQLCGLTRAACWRRLERLRSGGVIRGLRGVIDWRKLGYGVEVSLRVSVDKTSQGSVDAVIAKARKIPEVVEIQTFLGRVDLRLSVRAKDMQHYQRIYRDHILTLPHIADIEALVRVATIKEDENLPI